MYSVHVLLMPVHGFPLAVQHNIQVSGSRLELLDQSSDENGVCPAVYGAK
jgi:hypothetical protein